MKISRVGNRGEEVTIVSADGLRGWRVDSLLPAGNDSVLTQDGSVAAKDALSNPDGLEEYDLSAVRFGPPLERVGKIVCIGLNYRRHAAEAGMSIPDEPILFLKAADTVGGPADDVLIPRRSRKTDYEVELGVVIGATARYLATPAEAPAHIFGFVAANDVSEREFQLERNGQWDKGKNCETFSPLGPFLVTADEVPNSQALRLRSWVNGESRQDSSTADMIFSVDYLVWYVSQYMVLYPGDVILTGTPEGVGSGFEPPRFLRQGDVVRIEIEGLGTQQHRFVSSDETTQRGPSS